MGLAATSNSFSKLCTVVTTNSKTIFQFISDVLLLKETIDCK